jgi:hypothetical protein
MEKLWEALTSGELLTSGRMLAVARAVTFLVVGLLLARILASAAARHAAPRVGAPGAMIGRRGPV